MIGLFYEMGPLKINSNAELLVNSESWLKHSSMLFIDSPVGTGFSFVDIPFNSSAVHHSDEQPFQSIQQLLSRAPTGPKKCVLPDINEEARYNDGFVQNQAAVAADLVDFLDQFYELFPAIRNVDLYITGESYGGKYVPAFAHKVHMENMKRDNKIPLKGIAVGNGLTDPITQVKYHAVHALALGLVSTEQAAVMDLLGRTASEYTCLGDYASALEARLHLMDLFRNATGNVNFYDVRRGNKQYERHEMYKLLRDSKVQNSLHAPAVYEKDERVFSNLMLDIMKSAKEYVTVLLNGGYRVLLYQGQYDFRDGIIESNEWIESLQWNAKGLPKREIWMVDDQIGGYVTTSSNLVRVELLNAGHLAPGDQPKSSREMIYQFLLNW